jgi:cytochrome c-type biogenesis protein
VPDTLALALAAGMLAAVNPCGFALLPAYLSILVTGDDSPTAARSVARAVALTGWMTVGFVVVFGVFGLVISPVASQVQQHLPWFTVLLGMVLALSGLWLALGRELPIARWRPAGPEVARTVPAMVGFGASYAAASLTCSIGPFLALVVVAFRTGSVAAGAAHYLAYAVGMGLLVGLAAVAVALARRGLVQGMRRSGRWVPRATGVLLLVVGSYVAWYGAWELRVLAGADADDPVIEAAARVQAWLSGLVQRATP